MDVLAALRFGISIPELFPTEARMRASGMCNTPACATPRHVQHPGMCNTIDRAATIPTPFLVVELFADHGVVGVPALMVGLLFGLILAVAGLGIEPRQRSLEYPGSGLDGDAADQRSAIAR
jgi:putative MFS transporter